MVKKLIKIDKKVAWNKTKRVEGQKKLNDHIASYAKLINDISEKFILILANELIRFDE